MVRDFASNIRAILVSGWPHVYKWRRTVNILSKNEALRILFSDSLIFFISSTITSFVDTINRVNVPGSIVRKLALQHPPMPSRSEFRSRLIRSPIEPKPYSKFRDAFSKSE